MVIIVDIECGTFGKPDPNKDVLKFIGVYDLDTNETYIFKDVKPFKAILKQHRVVITYNGRKYDEIVLVRNGVSFRNHLHIDLYEVVDKRALILGILHESKSLANVCKCFSLQEHKGELDYSILNKTEISYSELKEIEKYLTQDLITTKGLWEYLYNYFLPFKEEMSEYDQKTFKWLTTALSVYAYKVICSKLGVKDEYSDTGNFKTFKGGFVAEPETLEEHDNIYCLDYASLYPHLFIQGNLYSHSCNCCKEEDKWKGNEVFNLNGVYCSKRQGKIELLLKEFYLKRKEYKKNKDKREYAIKIIINTIYGLSGCPKFKVLYNHNTASDCTEMARSCCIYARDWFRKEGYKILYSDTDSVYLKDVFNDKERLMKVKSEMVIKLKTYFQFPETTFDMSVDEEIKHIWFFKSGDKNLKKQYIYVTNGGKVKVKGLPMIKTDGSKIGWKIFKKYMEPQTLQGAIKFDYSDINKWLDLELKEDIKTIRRRFKVFNESVYKNESQIQAQIAKKYGAGVHYLIPNKRLGVGKGTKYCKYEEFEERGYGINDLVLTKFWKEMEHFCDNVPKMQQCKVFAKPKKEKIQRCLFEWTNV